MSWEEYKYWFFKTYENQPIGSHGCGGPVIMYGLLIAWCVLCLTSCKTVYVPVKEVHTEVVHKTDSFLQKDSVFLHDSVNIHQRHDTVFFEKWHTKYRDKIKEVIRIDSFIKNDSIPVPYPVEKKLSRWQQTKQDWGGFAIVFSFIVLGLIILRFFTFLRRKVLSNY